MADLTNEELVKRVADALDKIKLPTHIRCDPLMAEVLAICDQRDAARAEVERMRRRQTSLVQLAEVDTGLLRDLVAVVERLRAELARHKETS